MERIPDHSTARHWQTLVALLVVVVVAGCRGIWSQPSKPVLPSLPPEITKAELIHYLNCNADAVDSWVSRECKIKVRTPQGLSARMHATMACAEPSSFRLSAKGAFAKADLGSNDSMCWWWTQPGDGVMYTVKHEDMDTVRSHPMFRQTMSIPFEPDWLMEVLGVSRLDTSGMTLHRDVEPGRVSLASVHRSRDGQLFRRIVVVDLVRGVVVAHRLVDSSNHTIARATLSEHVKVGQAVLPRTIEITWPTMKMSLTMTIDNVEINQSLGGELWTPPAMQVAQLDLGERLQQIPHEKMMPPAEKPLRSASYSVQRDEDLPWDDPAPRRRWFGWLGR